MNKEERIEKIVLRIIKAIQIFAAFCMAVAIVLCIEYGIDGMLMEMGIMSIITLILVYSTHKRLMED